MGLGCESLRWGGRGVPPGERASNERCAIDLHDVGTPRGDFEREELLDEHCTNKIT